MYRTATQIEGLIQLLAGFFPGEATRVALPEATVEGRTVHALRLRGGGGGGERRGILLVGGVHARELMNPDLLIELAIDLVVAYRDNDPIVLGDRTWSATDVRVIMEALDVWMIPCANPDGRHHVQTVFSMWRKNRRDNPGTSCEGVDLNRNLDVLWGVTEGQVSCNPCSDVFCGPSAFSEPETRNVRWLMDNHRVDCFVDVHSYSELVLYPWGHAPTQTSDPSQRFTDLPSGTCAPIAEEGYAEYMAPRDRQRFQTVAQRVVEAIADVRGRFYTPQPGLALYPTTGTHGDYAYARHIADPAKGKTYGFTMETGTSFQPADPVPFKTEAKSGLLSFAQQCICAIELIGGRFLQGDTVLGHGLRRLRDDVLATTPGGREWIALFESAQVDLARAVMEDPELGERLARIALRAEQVLADEAEVVTEADAELVGEVVEGLHRRPMTPELRRGLGAAQEHLRASVGQGREDIVTRVVANPPAGDGAVRGGGEGIVRYEAYITDHRRPDDEARLRQAVGEGLDLLPPGLSRDRGGGWRAHAFLSPDELTSLSRAGLTVEVVAVIEGPTDPHLIMDDDAARRYLDERMGDRGGPH